jgi:DNA-binding transcriptional regulator YiaG
MASNNNDGWTVVHNGKKKRKDKNTTTNTDPSNTNNNTSTNRPYTSSAPRGINRPQGAVQAHINQGRNFISFGNSPNSPPNSVLNSGRSQNVQDWNQVTFRGGSSSSNRRAGPTTKEKRPPRGRDEARHLSKIDEETETFHHKRVSKSLSHKIQQYRTANHLTQKQLAQKLNLPVDIVQTYEKGSAIPNTSTINKFNKLINHPL